MAPPLRDMQLPPRTEKLFDELLAELNACGHNASELIARNGLPGWCHSTLFFFLGYIGKAGGRVTEADIGFAETLIQCLRLSPRHRRRAISRFQHGKDTRNLPVLKGLPLRLTSRLRPAPALKVSFALCHAAQLHGKPNTSRRHRVEDAIDQLGLDLGIADDILDSYARKVWVQPARHPSPPSSYQQACEVIGVTRRDSLDTIKKAYRKRVSECHPDKLARDLSGREQELAKERLLRYQQAWEVIKKYQRARR
ncbi:DnaJ domain-containing protein [Marinobacter sp. X15-166B]|uniref:DnaJ domain-containing protein n=1 Tax=Marinobacter sp. X15-166B TaxID=1897620 RepID=UPI00085C7722|nr:DnaJ domain-containing protein [Marinobacter sp. X15-166B]OEY65719.1 molecular chaperone DjlA [Marinobacter sp. X15-166B]